MCSCCHPGDDNGSAADLAALLPDATYVEVPGNHMSAVTKPGGYLSVGVEPYGGGLWYSWLDRDLSLAGRVIVRKPDGGFDSRLVRVALPTIPPLTRADGTAKPALRPGWADAPANGALQIACSVAPSSR